MSKIDIYPNIQDVPPCAFFPAIWQGKQAWTNGHILLHKKPKFVGKDKPSTKGVMYCEGWRINKAREAYKNPINADNKLGIDCLRNQYDIKYKGIYNKKLRTIEFGIPVSLEMADKTKIYINMDYLAIFYELYGTDIKLRGSGSIDPVQLFLDNELIGLIMPMKM